MQFQRLKESFARINDVNKWDYNAWIENDYAALDKEGLLRKEYWTEEQWELLQNFGRSYCKELAARNNRRLLREGMLARVAKAFVVYIYGAGIRGKKVCEYLQGKDLSVKGFIITEKNALEQSVLERPILSIEQANFSEEEVVLIAIKPPGLYEAIRELEMRGITNYIAVDDELYRSLGEDKY